MCSRLYLSLNPNATVCSLDHTDIISSVTCHKITNYMMQFLEVAAGMGIVKSVSFHCHLVDTCSNTQSKTT